jgi:putative salt-induced outer membrane protein YdiY
MSTRASSTLLLTVVLCLTLAGRAAADEILFLNGDRISGKVVGAAGGKLIVKTDVAGEISVDLSKVKTFSTDDPIVLRAGDATLRSKVTGSADGTVQIVPVPGGTPQAVALKEVTQINPPPVKWTGDLTLNALVTSGNSKTENIGATFNAARRSEQDRITLGAGYYYGRQEDRDTGDKDTTIDNVFGAAKYDYFLTKQLYLYGGVRAERDRIADLDLRFTPSIGLGYQWYETPTFNLSTEAGLAWVYEDYRNADSDDHFAARLAYHVDWTPHQAVKLFHNFEWLPAVDDPFDDYNLNADAGLRATITRGFFAEMKIEFRYDSIPAPGSEKDDVRYLLGVGWSF